MRGQLARLAIALSLATAMSNVQAPANAAERVALVIGNGAYRHASALTNPANDARAIARSLAALGFEVVAGYDLDAEAMLRTIERFETVLADAEAGLIYYAGHGIGVDGVNYLLPIDAKLETRAALKREAISADWLLNDVMEGGDERVTILMLDACRNNPFARSFATRTRGAVATGLAEVRAKTGAYIAFATAPEDVAGDGSGENSPFTAAMLRHLPTPALEINELMTLVRNDVYTETGKDQLPWASSALLGKFFFVPPSDAAAASSPPATVLAAVPPQAERIDAEARAEPEVTDVDPQQPGPDELREAALKRVENALLQNADARRRVQEELDALGHAPGRPDGRFGPGTRTALRDFQAASSLEPTGYADKPTLALLERQVARLAPPAEEQNLQPRRSRPKLAAQADAAPRPAPAAANAGIAGGTMGVCTAAGGAGWASERTLTYDQCRKAGGRFAPF